MKEKTKARIAALVIASALSLIAGFLGHTIYDQHVRIIARAVVQEQERNL